MDDGARGVFPRAGHLHALFEVAHAGEILVEPIAVARGHAALEVFRLAADGVEDALPALKFAELRGDFGRRTLHEHPAKHVRRFFLARDEGARSRPRETALTLLDIDPESERRETRFVADAFCDVLIEGDGIAETATAGMRRRGEEAHVGGMTGVHVGMRHAAEHRKIVAMVREVLQVGREGVAAAGLSGEKLIGEQAEVIADSEQAARLFRSRGGGGARKGG